MVAKEQQYQMNEDIALRLLDVQISKSYQKKFTKSTLRPSVYGLVASSGDIADCTENLCSPSPAKRVGNPKLA